MIDRLFPMEVDVLFEDGLYRLGDTMIVTVEIRPRRDVELREGRVDLRATSAGRRYTP